MRGFREKCVTDGRTDRGLGTCCKTGVQQAIESTKQIVWRFLSDAMSFHLVEKNWPLTETGVSDFHKLVLTIDH